MVQRIYFLKVDWSYVTGLLSPQGGTSPQDHAEPWLPESGRGHSSQSMARDNRGSTHTLVVQFLYNCI